MTTDQQDVNEILQSFRNQRYAEALTGFSSFVESAGRAPLMLLRARRNIADCLFTLQEQAVVGQPWRDAFRDNLDAYFNDLAQVDSSMVAPVPYIASWSISIAR